MAFPLGEDNGGATLVQGADDVVEYQGIALLVVGENLVQALDRQVAGPLRRLELGLPQDEPVVKLPSSGCRLLIRNESDGAKLHLKDGVMTIAVPRSRGQSGHVAGFDLGQNPLE